MTTDIPAPQLTHQARETKRGRWRSYLLDADGKMLMYSPASFTDPADADRLGEFVVNGNEAIWGRKVRRLETLLAAERSMVDGLKSGLVAARSEAASERADRKWLVLAGVCGGAGLGIAIFALACAI